MQIIYILILMKVNQFLRVGMIIVVLCFSAAVPVYAYDPKEGSGLPVPRFASIKSDNAFVRTGPSMDYPIKYVFKREGLPVQIVQEFDAWRKIKDPDGETGWVHKLLLSGKRTAMIRDDVTNVFKHADGECGIADLAKGVIVTATECNGTWCQIEFNLDNRPEKGWIPQKNIWGIAETEKFD